MPVELDLNPFALKPEEACEVVIKGDFPHLIRREVDIYQVIGGLAGIANLLAYPDEQTIILQKLDGVNLGERIAELAAAGTSLSTSDVLQISCSVVGLLSRIHAGGCREGALVLAEPRPIAWYDLSPYNLLVDEQLRISAVDFGLSFFVGEHPESFVGQKIGTEETVSPEQYNGRPEHGQAADIFSFGSLIYFISHQGKAAFSEAAGDMNQQFADPPPPDTGNLQLDRIVIDCWRPEPAARPTAARLFKEINNISGPLLRSL